jgi:hypothetical protein
MITDNDKQLISAYADGGLSPDDVAAVEKLLAERQDCRAYLAELQKLSSSLQILKDESLSPDAELKILSNIKKERSMKPYQWKASAAVAATILVVVLALNNYTTRNLQGRFKDANIVVSAQIPAPYYSELAKGRADKETFQQKPVSGVTGRLKTATDDIGQQFAPLTETMARGGSQVADGRAYKDNASLYSRSSMPVDSLAKREVGEKKAKEIQQYEFERMDFL